MWIRWKDVYVLLGEIQKSCLFSEEDCDPTFTNNGRSLRRGTQREYSSKSLKHSIVKRILVFKG